MSPTDPEKMVMATAKAMAIADVHAATPGVVRHYVEDARKVLVGVLKAAKRQKWELSELLLALDPPKPGPKPWAAYQGPLPSRRGP
jgi:hypothetical protein